ncbi:MAG: PRC-barrel domain containing protein [Ignavibacteriales bacterium]
MLRSVKEFEKYKIIASDGEIGNAYEFYFDDVKWIMRYLVVETGNWLSRKQVLISPAAVNSADWKNRTLTLNLTKKQIEDSPDISTDKPVSRQHEVELMNYYNWPQYWDWEMGMPYAPGAAFMSAAPIVNDDVSATTDNTKHSTAPRKGDPHLRSSREVIGYNIQATDDTVGHVEDFIVDDNSWIIRYMVIDTGNRLIGGKRVLLAPHWIERVEWTDSRVHVAISSTSLRNSPPYDPSQTLNRDYEELLYEYYGLPKYWV